MELRTSGDYFCRIHIYRILVPVNLMFSFSQTANDAYREEKAFKVIRNYSPALSFHFLLLHSSGDSPLRQENTLE